MINMCGYKLETNWQNLTEIYLTWVKILQKVLGGYFFDSHCLSDDWMERQEMGEEEKGEWERGRERRGRTREKMEMKKAQPVDIAAYMCPPCTSKAWPRHWCVKIIVNLVINLIHVERSVFDHWHKQHNMFKSIRIHAICGWTGHRWPLSDQLIQWWPVDPILRHSCTNGGARNARLENAGTDCWWLASYPRRFAEYTVCRYDWWLLSLKILA